MDGLKKQLDAIILAMVGEDLVEKWWHSPNKHWDLKTPLEVYESGLEGRMSVKAYLYLHLSGGG